MSDQEIATLIASMREKIQAAVLVLNIPGHMQEAIIAYVMEGKRTGDFLEAVFSNDLVGAAAHGDHQNKPRIHNYAEFLMWYAPEPCWGTTQTVQEWRKLGGFIGMLEDAERDQISDSEG